MASHNPEGSGGASGDERAKHESGKSKGIFGTVTSWSSSLVGGITKGISSLIGYDDVEVVDPEGSKDDSGKEMDKGRFKPEEREHLWTMMHKYIGADVTSLVSLPVYLFEPMTTLQKMAELMEYTELLNKAAKEPDPFVKLALAGAWAISPYYAYQRTWKPFNPILGETYELRYNDITYIAEQVSHHPPMGAAHGDHPLWTYDCTSKLKTKFLGNVLDVYPVGQTRVFLKETQELLDLVPPPTKVHNLIFGRTWVDTYGDMILTNTTTGDKAVLYFQPCGWFGSGRYQIEGYVYDASETPKLKIIAKWNSFFNYIPCDEEGEPLPGAEEVEVWKLNEVPKGDKWGYTNFAHLLNNFSSAPKPMLASDSRVRPDRLNLERGDTGKAGSYKSKLEERQRAEKKERTGRNDKWIPRWFRPSGQMVWDGEMEVYEFTGTYLERAKAIADGSVKEEGPVPSGEGEEVEFSPWQYPESVN